MNNVCVNVTLTAFVAPLSPSLCQRTHLRLLCTNYLSLVLMCACSSSHTHVCVCCVCLCLTGAKWQLRHRLAQIQIDCQQLLLPQLLQHKSAQVSLDKFMAYICLSRCHCATSTTGSCNSSQVQPDDSSFDCSTVRAST